MILEETSVERAALHALELHDPGEAERFEREACLDPELATCAADFREVAALVAVAGCNRIESPPLIALTGALDRVGAIAPKRARIPWTMLAACAALLLLAGGGVTKIVERFSAGESPDPLTSSGSETPDRVVIMKGGQVVASMDASEKVVLEMLEKLNRMQRLKHSPEIIQDIARLRRELKSLRKVDAQRFAAGPRVARTVYIEMVEPGTEDEERGEGQLSERITDYIVEAIEEDVGNPESAPQPVIFSAGDVESLPEPQDFPDDAPFFYRDFPDGNDRFERIDDGRLWDGASQKIWIETDEAGTYQAIDPPTGFDPDFIDDYAGAIPAAGELKAPVVEPVIEEEPISPTAPEPLLDLEEVAVNPEPLAVTIYEETTGQGSVVVGNLQPAGDGQGYQLWMRNAADDQVVSVGMLPKLGDGTESFPFDLLGSGITPAGFFITLEVEDGVQTPGDQIILQGP